MNKIYYYNFQVNKNIYFDIQKNIIKNLGYELVDINYSNTTKELIKNKPNNSFIILNFIENGRGSGISLIRFYLKWFYILNSLKRNNKFVFVYHNLSVHDSSFIKGIISNLVLTYLKMRCDAIELLSYNSISYINRLYRKKCFYVPHSNYVNIYGPVIESKDNEYLTLLFIGNIRKYKNIEMILDIAKNLLDKKIKFVIRGNATDDAYCDQLLKISTNLNNVEIIPKYVADKELPEVLSQCDALILPYKKKSCLNSGVAILAGSYQKTYICPSIATAKDMPQNLIYSYDYTNEKEHFDNLQNAIIKMYSDRISNPNILKEKGLELQKYIIDKHSETVVAEAYKRMFENLCKKDI